MYKFQVTTFRRNQGLEQGFTVYQAIAMQNFCESLKISLIFT